MSKTTISIQEPKTEFFNVEKFGHDYYPSMHTAQEKTDGRRDTTYKKIKVANGRNHSVYFTQ